MDDRRWTQTDPRDVYFETMDSTGDKPTIPNTLKRSYGRRSLLDSMPEENTQSGPIEPDSNAFHSSGSSLEGPSSACSYSLLCHPRSGRNLLPPSRRVDFGDDEVSLDAPPKNAGGRNMGKRTMTPASRNGAIESNDSVQKSPTPSPSKSKLRLGSAGSIRSHNSNSTTGAELDFYSHRSNKDGRPNCHAPQAISPHGTIRRRQLWLPFRQQQHLTSLVGPIDRGESIRSFTSQQSMTSHASTSAGELDFYNNQVSRRSLFSTGSSNGSYRQSRTPTPPFHVRLTTQSSARRSFSNRSIDDPVSTTLMRRTTGSSSGTGLSSTRTLPMDDDDGGEGDEEDEGSSSIFSSIAIRRIGKSPPGFVESSTSMSSSSVASPVHHQRRVPSPVAPPFWQPTSNAGGSFIPYRRASM